VVPGPTGATGPTGPTGATGATGANATPGGADTQVQINDAGAFYGDANFTYNKTTSDLTLTEGTFTNTQAVAATSVDGIVLQTSATATVGAQKYSPALHFKGSGWGTTGGAAQSVDWRIENVPVQGANPSANLVLSASLNGGAYATRATFFSGYRFDSRFITSTDSNGYIILYNGNPLRLQHDSGLISFGGSDDVILSRSAAAGLRLGAAAANPPVAQTLSVQDASGTNISPAKWTFRSSRGTGSAVNTGILYEWQTPDVGGSGTTLQTATAKMGLSGDGKLILPKTSGLGIQVDLATPTFPWADITGEIILRGVGATDPAFNTYRGNIRGYQFAVNDEVWNVFHIPHDYVPGSDLFIHCHWSHAATTVTGGSVTWGFDITSARGHNQEAFAASVNPTVAQNASTTQYQHMIAEVQFSAGSPSATQINNSTIEPDSLVLVRTYLSANAMTVSGGGVPDPFLHTVDIHYQSTGIGTKQKAPAFYT
jgi:hypothetical protein